MINPAKLKLLNEIDLLIMSSYLYEIVEMNKPKNGGRGHQNAAFSPTNIVCESDDSDDMDFPPPVAADDNIKSRRSFPRPVINVYKQL